MFLIFQLFLLFTFSLPSSCNCPKYIDAVREEVLVASVKTIKMEGTQLKFKTRTFSNDNENLLGPTFTWNPGDFICMTLRNEMTDIGPTPPNFAGYRSNKFFFGIVFVVWFGEILMVNTSYWFSFLHS